MIFHDFVEFTNSNDPTNTGRPPQMVRGVFPLGNVRFRGVSKCLNNIFNISQVLVAGTESLRPLGVTKMMKMLKIDENHGFSRFSMIS